MIFLFFMYSFILLIVIYIHSIILKPIKPYKPYYTIEDSYKNNKKIAIIFGASGELGIKIVTDLLKSNYTVIGVGRRYNKWVETIQIKCPSINITNDNLLKTDIKLKDNTYLYDAIIDKRLHWLKADVRISSEIEKVIKETLRIYDHIDLAVNISIIDKKVDYLKEIISTTRDKDDIYIRLLGAYISEYNGRYGLNRIGSPGNEHPFFTNLVGIINLNRIEKEFGVKKIINPNNVDELTDALTKKLSELDSDGTIRLDLRKDNLINFF